MGVDNMQTGRRENLAHLSGSNRFHLMECDIALCPDVSADYIFNLACPASPPHYQADPIQTLKTSVVGTLRLLEIAKRESATFIQASTSEVYGDPAQHPQTEDYWGHVNPIGKRACYDEGKRAAETLCCDFSRAFGLNTKIARIFNTYGPRMRADDGRVVSNFVCQALSGKPITIYGDGNQTRSFCYVDDLIAALLAIAFTDVPPCFPFNIGNPQEFTMKQLAELVQEMIGTDCVIEYRPLPADDPKQRKPDLTRARTLLNWEPSTDLRNGLSKTISHFRSALSTELATETSRPDVNQPRAYVARG